MALDPDRLLQRLIDATATELRRIRANARLGGPIDVDGLEVTVKTCPTCRRDMCMSDNERRWLLDAGKLIASVAFGARKLVVEKLLKSLSEGGLDAFEKATIARAEGGQWLPEP